MCIADHPSGVQMLESISLKFTELAEPLRVPAQGVTVFVGPNNSGKSLVLREIEQDISSHPTIAAKIIADFEIVWIPEEQFDEDIAKLVKRSPVGTSPDHVYVGRFGPDGSFHGHSTSIRALRQHMKDHQEKRWLTSQFLRFFLIRLDGRTRFELTNDRPKGDLLGKPQNMLMHLFQDEDARKRVREIVFDAFNLYFTIEQLSANDLRIRLSPKAPNEYEQHWNNAAREFHGNALHIKEASDGVQAFVGIVCAVLSGDLRRLLDHPIEEAYAPWITVLRRIEAGSSDVDVDFRATLEVRYAPATGAKADMAERPVGAHLRTDAPQQAKTA
jgi:hypothetical protein